MKQTINSMVKKQLLGAKNCSEHCKQKDEWNTAPWFSFFFFFFFGGGAGGGLPHHLACGDLSSPTREWTGLSAVKALSSTNWTAREVPTAPRFNIAKTTDYAVDSWTTRVWTALNCVDPLICGAFSIDTQSALCVWRCGIRGYGGLATGREHPRMLASEAGPGTSPPQIPRGNVCTKQPCTMSGMLANCLSQRGARDGEVGAGEG